MEEYEIRLYFGCELANLYELGWISSDLSQLMEFSKLLEDGNSRRANKYFGKQARGFNRYFSITEEREKRPEIIDIRKGSIELVIAGATLAASIIMPLVAIAVKRYFDAKDETMTFELSPKDPALKRMIDAYEKGDFGQGIEGLTMLVELLGQKNYSVTIKAKDVYLIEHVIEKYSQRIIKTIKKNR